MGGDFVPHAPVEGVASVLAHLPADVRLVLIGDEPVLRAELARLKIDPEKVDVVHAPSVIGMHEHAAKAFTAKPDSSIAVGIGMTKKGLLHAFISAGNTGAMMVGSVIALGTIEGVLRPTIGAFYPSNGSYALIADVGANTDCKPEVLVQFGQIGAVFMKEVMGIENPRVALLNIGEEPSKGNQIAQAAHQLFLQQQDRINFVGNAEGRDMNRGVADVYVCDGFTGNILLKFAESFYDYMKEKLPNDHEIETFNFERVGGLPILGVKGIVVVGHGISSPLAFHNMILRTGEIVRTQLPDKIARALAETVTA
jgi:glycerol-3-phosphate acyltransferase PlsX